MNVKAKICKSFDAHASEYERNAKIQYEIGERLFERLSFLKIKPRYILDLGCGTGVFSQRLRNFYPNSKIISFDLSTKMLAQVQLKQKWWKKWPLVNGDMMNMPFAHGVFDLVFANQIIHWSEAIPHLFMELSRVMNIGGCLMLSTLGPDTFIELKKAWAVIDCYAHVNDFIDMHEIGDFLLAEHFMDPVVDMERLVANYLNFSQLVSSLKSQGIPNTHVSRNHGLTTKKSWHGFEQEIAKFCTAEGRYPLTYEVIYGHAWKGEQRRFTGGTEIAVSIESMRKLMHKSITAP